MHACRLREMVRIKAGRETRIPWSSRCDKIRRPRSSRTSLEQTKNRVRFFSRCLRKHVDMGGASEKDRFSPDTKQTRVLRCVNEKRGKDPPLWRADGSCTSSKFEGLFEPLSLSLLSPSFREKRNGRRNYYRERKKLLLLEFCPLLIVPSSIISYV